MTTIAYLVCALVWGTTWFAIRVNIAPGGYPPLLGAALRFTIAGAVLLAVLAIGWARPVPRGRRALAWLVLAGLGNAASYALIYTAETRIPGGLTAVLFGTSPLVMAVLATITRSERVSPASLGGAILALLGIAVVFWDRLAVSPAQAAAVAMVLGGVFLSASYTILLKRQAAGQHPLATTAVFLAVTSLPLWTLAMTLERRPAPWPPPFAPTAALLYLALIGSVLAFACYFYLVRRVRLMTVTTLVFVQPVIALAVDAVWEHGVALVPRTYAGAAITMVGVAGTVLARARG